MTDRSKEAAPSEGLGEEVEARGQITNLLDFAVHDGPGLRVLVFFKENYISLPAFPVEDPKDPTGAGDSFAGGFVGFLCGQARWDSFSSLIKAAAYGTVMASFNVENFGTRRLEALTSREIHDRFSRYARSLDLS